MPLRRIKRSFRATLLALPALVFGAVRDGHAQETASAPVEAGRRIYEQGELISGAPLVGVRGNGIASKGKTAACAGCHQRSGFGRGEGSNFVPPITSGALFAKDRSALDEPRTAASIKAVQPAHLTRPAYDETSLARALREGVGAGGQVFQVLMPRYDFAEADLAALTAYLRTLSAAPSPGATATGTRFATVIAPGQSIARRKQFLDVLEGCFNDRGPEAATRDPWLLDVWNLEGAPETWSQQLAAFARRAPAFALISGLGDAEWGPVHAFCNETGVPCLFPNVDAPGGPTDGGMTFYLSRGVALEADVAARYLADLKDQRPRRIVQIVGASATAQKAAAALEAAAIRMGFVLESRAFQDGRASVMAGLAQTDALVAWLAPDEVAALSRQGVPRVRVILMSGWMGGFETIPLSMPWKKAASVIIPVDAPVRRALRVRYNLEPWLQRMGQKVGDSMLQGNTLAACKIMTESLWRMRGNFVRDYLVEWIENYPGTMGNAPAPQAYPRFVLSSGQRVSSHGAFIARFKKQDPRELELARDWLVP